MGIILLLFIFSPLILLGALIYAGFRWRNYNNEGFQIAGSALIATCLISIFIYAYFMSAAKQDAWGWSYCAVPVMTLKHAAIVFGILWPLFAVFAIIRKKLGFKLLVIVVPIFILSIYVISINVRSRIIESRSYRADFTRDEIRNLLQKQRANPERPNDNPFTTILSVRRLTRGEILQNIVRNKSVAAAVLSDFIEFEADYAYDDIINHRNITPELLDKLAHRCNESFFRKIAQNRKTLSGTLEYMFANTQSLSTRGQIINNPSMSDRFLADYINAVLTSTNKREKIRLIESTYRITPLILDKLSHDQDDRMRLAVANNIFTPISVIQHLQTDQNDDVKRAARRNLEMRDREQREYYHHYGLHTVGDK